MKKADVREVVDQLRAEIDQMCHQTYGKKNGERFQSVQKLNQLRNLLSTIEELDDSLDHLLEEQDQKRKSS
jgi:uncharacterized membrane protein YccC